LIVDASALLAVVLHEEDAARYETALADATSGILMSPINYVETFMRAATLDGAKYVKVLDELVEAMGIVIEPVTAEQAKLARTAFDRFGKGRHPARLNLGDCFAYALAKARRRPLLFKGNDFTKTDVEAAL
jgi:ribonuclease VapC